MVTREELEGFRQLEKELRELRGRMRRAELAAMESGRAEDRERAITEAQRYDALADEAEAERDRILAEICNLKSAEQRRIMRARYVDGMMPKAIAAREAYSKRTVERIIEKAIEEMSRE